jgi:hypothetical protein
MNLRRGLFRIWIVLTLTYWVFGFAYDAEALLLKLHHGQWVHLLIAIAMALGVPLIVLGLGSAIFGIADGFRPDKKNSG